MEKRKKILVLCGGKFAFKTLQLLAFENFLCGIGIGKGSTMIVDALEKESEESQIAFKSFQNKSSLQEMRLWVDEVQPDFIFSLSFPFLIPEEVLSYGKEKFINFHPGPLPQFRGPMPIFEVLKQQKKQTAISVHFMNTEFDQGNIIFNDPVLIDESETYGQLAVKLSDRLAQVSLNMANMVQFASIIPNSPQDNSLAYYFEKPQLSDTYINWKRMSASEIISLINACNPWNNGADIRFKGEQAKIVVASLLNEPHDNALPGTIISVAESGNIHVACSDNNQISIEVVSTDSGTMTSRQFAAMYPIAGSAFN
ncbi:methionyl-tRNA formyltransferase [Flavobacterium sp.]|uniref:methionyl-tRNA formyltransferase n=1 Tax=Flavobacterium sp. TaxID=239 RepID=UPI003D6BC645